MKHLKKVIALVLTLVTAFAMATPAFADDPEPPAYDTPITVTGLGTGDTVKFYQVIEWVGETTDDSDVAGWKAVSGYESVLTKAKLTEILVGTKADPTANPPVEAKDPTGITSEIAGQLAKLATGGVDGTVSGTTATLNNAAPGMWMALVTPADANTIYNPVFVSSDYTAGGATVGMGDSYNGDAVAKKSTLTLTKTAANAQDYNSDNAKTTAVGDTVNFTVTTTIPGYGDVYTNPHFVVSDTLTALKLDQNSVAVTGLQKGADKDYTVETSDTGYTITFTEKYLKSLKTATEVTITYNAEVTSAAANVINEEDNEVKIEYSHNPNQQGDYDVKKDTTQHYTFSIDASGIGESESEKIKGKKSSELVKVGVDAKGDPITETKTTSELGDPEKDYAQGPLAGATFGLWKSTDSACEGDPFKTASTTDDGRMNFAGLDAGTYYLKEISAPAGYVPDTTIHTVVITATTKSVKVTEWWNGTDWVSTKPASGTAKEVTYDTDILESYKITIDGKTAAEYQFKNPATATSTEINWEEAELIEHPFPLTNTQGTALPSTGGMGTKILYTIGGLMVVAGGVFLAAKKRMSTIEE